MSLRLLKLVSLQGTAIYAVTSTRYRRHLLAEKCSEWPYSIIKNMGLEFLH